MLLRDARNRRPRVAFRRFAGMRPACRVEDGGLDSGPLLGRHIDPIESMGDDESLKGAIHMEVVYMFFSFLMARFLVVPG